MDRVFSRVVINLLYWSFFYSKTDISSGCDEGKDLLHSTLGVYIFSETLYYDTTDYPGRRTTRHFPGSFNGPKVRSFYYGFGLENGE